MKKIICLFLVLFLSGCSVVYDLEITDSFIKESCNINTEESDNVAINESIDGQVERISGSLEDLIKEYYNDDYLAFNNRFYDGEYYQKSFIDDGNGLNLKYDFIPNDYKYSNLLNYCFNDISITKSGDYFTIDIKDSSICFSQDGYNRLDNVVINIRANNVIEDNADRIFNGVYTWELSRNNPDAEIFLKIKVSDNNKVKDNLWIFILVLFVIVVAFVLSLIFVRHKHSLNNEF